MLVRQLKLRGATAGLPEIQRSPRERGSLAMIVRRPQSGEREVLDVGELDVEDGLVGDRWALGKRRRTNQLTLINARLVGADRAEPRSLAARGRSALRRFRLEPRARAAGHALSRSAPPRSR